MAKKSWTFELEDGEHTVTLEHGFFSGKRVIHVNGELLEESQQMLDLGSAHAFELSGHDCVVDIRTNLLSFGYDLVIDGRSLETGEEGFEPQPMPPGWAWIFVAACAVIPFVAVGGAVPALIGFGGAAVCIAIARDVSKVIALRVVLCMGVTALCWLLFLGPVAGMLSVQ